MAILDLKWTAVIASGVLAMSGIEASADPQPLATYEDYLAMPRPAPGAEIRYGTAPSQGIDIFLPRGTKLHPVVVFIHGGCWRESIPGRESVRAIGADLARRGIAVWSIGYRRADEAGGGYPGTFQDVATAIDRLRAEAGHYHFDMAHVVFAGHSAGGHLALWAAGRTRIPASSVLHTPQPLMPRAVVSIAGITDLSKPQSSCGPEIVAKLTGPATPGHPDVFADTSPVRLVPNAPGKWLVSGDRDTIVPPAAAQDYAAAAGRAGQQVTTETLSGAGHFDLVRPGGLAWEKIADKIEAALH